MVVISVVDFSKAYDRTLAVDGLSFDVPAGHILGMLGPNGAGKTTTMRALAGIVPPSGGRLSIGGADLKTQPVAAKSMTAFVPDDPKLFDMMTVWEHLQFIASAYRVKDLEAAAAPLLERFELADKRDLLAQELSRGMRQKVAICCANLHAPKALLLDEPMTGLDPASIRTLKDSIRQRAAGGAAVILSSHLISLIEDLCTDLLILHRGKSLFLGSVEQARQRYPALNGDASLEDIFFSAIAS